MSTPFFRSVEFSITLEAVVDCVPCQLINLKFIESNFLKKFVQKKP